MEQCSTACGRRACLKDKEFANILIIVATTVIGLKGNHTGWARKLCQMEPLLTAAGLKAKPEVMELKFCQMEHYSRESGRKADSFLASASFLTDKYMMDSGMKENQTDSVSKFGLTVVVMKVIGIKVSQSVKELKLTKMALQREANGKAEFL